MSPDGSPALRNSRMGASCHRGAIGGNAGIVPGTSAAGQGRYNPPTARPSLDAGGPDHVVRPPGPAAAVDGTWPGRLAARRAAAGPLHGDVLDRRLRPG